MSFESLPYVNSLTNCRLFAARRFSRGLGSTVLAAAADFLCHWLRLLFLHVTATRVAAFHVAIGFWICGLGLHRCIPMKFEISIRECSETTLICIKGLQGVQVSMLTAPDLYQHSIRAMGVNLSPQRTTRENTMKNVLRACLFSTLLALPVAASAQTDTPKADAPKAAGGMMMNCPMMADMGGMQKNLGTMMSDVESMMKGAKDAGTKERLQKMHDGM